MCGAVYLSQPCMADGPEFLSAVSKSVGMHHPWVAPPACQLSYASYIKRLAHEAHFGFFIRLKASDDLVGIVKVMLGVRLSKYTFSLCLPTIIHACSYLI